MNNVKYSPERAPGREHVPRYPPGFVAIRFVQLVFALIIIGLAAYGISLLPFDGSIFILVVVSCKTLPRPLFVDDAVILLRKLPSSN